MVAVYERERERERRDESTAEEERGEAAVAYTLRGGGGDLRARVECGAGGVDVRESRESAGASRGRQRGRECERAPAAPVQCVESVLCCRVLSVTREILFKKPDQLPIKSSCPRPHESWL